MRRTGGLHERAHLDARAVHVDEQEGDAVMLGDIGIGAYEQHAPVAELRGRVPHLLAVDHELVAVAIGAAPEAGEIAARTGLAEELAPRIVAGEQTREVLAALLVAAVAHEGRPEHGDGGRDERRRRFDAGQLFAEDALVPRLAAAAAVFTRIGESGETVVEEHSLPCSARLEVLARFAFVRGEVQRPWIGITPRRKMRVEERSGLRAERRLLSSLGRVFFERGHPALRLPMAAIEVVAPRAETVAANFEDADHGKFERRAVAWREALGAFGEHVVARNCDTVHRRLDARELRHERAVQHFGDGRAADGLAGKRNVDVDRVVGEVRGDLFFGHLGPASTELTGG